MTIGAQPQVPALHAAAIHTATWARITQDSAGNLVKLAWDLPTERTGHGIATAALIDPAISAYLGSIAAALSARMHPVPPDGADLDSADESFNDGIQEALWMLTAYLPPPL